MDITNLLLSKYIGRESHMNKAFIGLGSNIEPRKHYLDQAIDKLTTHPYIHVIKVSSIYETPPVGYLDQQSFLNMVVELEVELESLQLLKACQQIEKDLDRKRSFKNGPRTIDLDILLFNDEYRDLEGLQLPHPRMVERAFVLVPLCEIAPNQIVPTIEKTTEEILQDLPKKDIQEIVRWENTET